MLIIVWMLCLCIPIDGDCVSMMVISFSVPTSSTEMVHLPRKRNTMVHCVEKKIIELNSWMKYWCSSVSHKINASEWQRLQEKQTLATISLFSISVGRSALVPWPMNRNYCLHQIASKNFDLFNLNHDDELHFQVNWRPIN